MDTARNLAPDVDDFSYAFDDAQFRKDRASLDRALAEEMVYIDSSGKIAGREAFIAKFDSPATQFEPFVITARSLVQLGADVIAVTADCVIRGTKGSDQFEARFRFTDIFRRRGTTWEVIFVQATPKPGP
jgi:hypothetical protein